MGAQDATMWKQVLYNEIGARVRAQRDKSNLTLREVAFKLGLSYQSAARVEEGQGAPVHFLVAFAQLTSCDVASLIPKISTTFQRRILKSDS